MRHTQPEIAVSLSLQELKLFRRALAQAAEEGHLNKKKAWRRITMLQRLEWEAEDRQRSPQQDSQRLSEATKAGLARQRLAGTPGPKGYLAPGRPPVEFDAALADSMHAAGASQDKIAKQCGVSKTTIWRYFQKNPQKETSA